MNIKPVTNHREREKGVIVYPVYSRRSQGLSIGINLFPDKKSCQFDCPYCEVFPFPSGAEFSLDQMEDDLRGAINNAQKENINIKDICFSGNGEPTLSPSFKEAFKLAEKIRKEAAPCAKLVIITNGTGLFQEQIFSLLKEAACEPSLDIWLKLDAGTSDWYRKINRCAVHHDKLLDKIKEFTISSPVTIQTMLCAVGGSQPSDAESKTWEDFVCELAQDAAGNIRKVQIYGKARPAPEDPYASPLPEEYLEKRSKSLYNALKERGIITPVEIYL